MHAGISADELPGEAKGAGCHFASLRRLRVEAQKVRGGDAGWEDRLIPFCQPLNGCRTGTAWPKGGRAGTVVNAFAQSLQCSIAGQTRECLGNGRKGLVPEVVVTPQSLTSAFNLKADRTSGRAGFGGLCHLPYYVGAVVDMSSFFAIKLDIHSDVPTTLDPVFLLPDHISRGLN